MLKYKQRRKRRTRYHGPVRISTSRKQWSLLPTINWGIKAWFYRYSNRTGKHTFRTWFGNFESEGRRK